MTKIQWGNDVLTLTISGEPGGPELHAIRAGSVAVELPPGLPAVEILTLGQGHEFASSRLSRTLFGDRSQWVAEEETRGNHQYGLVIESRDPESGLHAAWTLTAYSGVAAFRSEVTVRNDSDTAIGLRSVSSWSAHLGVLPGTDRNEWTLHHARSDWMAENRWMSENLGPVTFPNIDQPTIRHRRRGKLAVSSSGTWSTGTNLPVGALVNDHAKIAWMWQVEHNGPWQYEIAEDLQDFALTASGPTDADHAWMRTLQPGESFTSAPVSVAFADSFTSVMQAMTVHRRLSRRAHSDNSAMKVVFNDYMNTLNGDPTTDKLLPLISSAAHVGAEVFCIDAGWYDDGGDWWDSVGEWVPSTVRFPSGLAEVIEHIHDLGMIPGLWLEPEVIGINSPLALTLPRDAFICRAGARVVEHGRYHLDLRHPAAVAHLNEVIDRLIDAFGIGYFKLDYNIDPRTGSDVDTVSTGDALLEHNRAYLRWIDDVLTRYPSLILENCGSGGMRADPATLRHFPLQSTSDQQHYLRYPTIAASAPASMVPEQAASWAYPQPDMSDEQVTFCLITGLVGRFYLSGYLNEMSPAQLEIVSQSVATAKTLRTHIEASAPFWPLGLPEWDASVVVVGFRTRDADLIAVWDRSRDGLPISIPLSGDHIGVETVFPSTPGGWRTSIDEEVFVVTNATGEESARLFRLDREPY